MISILKKGLIVAAAAATLLVAGCASQTPTANKMSAQNNGPMFQVHNADAAKAGCKTKRCKAAMMKAKHHCKKHHKCNHMMKKAKKHSQTADASMTGKTNLSSADMKMSSASDNMDASTHQADDAASSKS